MSTHFIFFILFVLYSIQLLFGQSIDINGTWKGNFTQIGHRDVFYMELSLSENKNSIRGTSRFVSNDGRGGFVLFNIIGQREENQIRLYDISVLDVQSLNGELAWCKKLYDASIHIKGDSLQIRVNGK